jgi:accessory gene regulator protein AgrB
MWVDWILLGTGLFLWFLTINCLRGCNWILVSGISTSSKAVKLQYRMQNDVPAMNRYMGKTIFLPFSIYCTVLWIMMFFNIPWMVEAWFGIVLTVFTFLMVGFCFYAVVQVLGGRFKRRV